MSQNFWLQKNVNENTKYMIQHSQFFVYLIALFDVITHAFNMNGNTNIVNNIIIFKAIL